MRLIDADALIAYLTENWIPANIDAIDAQPTITPEPHWIPCSERLPELDDEVLVTDDGGELRHCIFCTWGETWCGFITYEEGMRIIATAWMPLPPVYRGDEK